MLDKQTSRRSRRLLCEKLHERSMLAGDLDPTFANYGILADPMVAAIDAPDQVQELAIDQQGRTLLLSMNQMFTSEVRNTITVTRTLADGAIDLSFGRSGMASIALPGRFDNPIDITVQADGKIVILTEDVMSANVPNPRYNLIRLTSSGGLDSTFGTNGKVLGFSSLFGQFDPSRVVASKTGELFVFAGRYDDAVIIKHLPSGEVDKSFGKDGICSIVGKWAISQDLQILSDGSIVAGISTSNGFTNFEFELVRVSSAGQLINTFGTDGRFKIAVTNDQNYASYGRIRIGLDSAENVYVAGMRRTGVAQDFFVYKLNRDGVLDKNYGSQGQAEIVTGEEWGTLLQEALVSANGEVVLTATLGNFREPIVIKLDSAGRVDRTQSPDGLNRFSSDDRYDDTGLGGAARLPNGKIVMALTDLKSQTVSVFRVDDLGKLASSATFNPVKSSGYALGDSVVELADGKLLTVSADLANEQSYIVLTRYLANGKLDTSYSVAGRSRIAARQYDGVLSNPIISHGTERFVAAVDAQSLKIARLTADGTIDLTFGTDGWIVWTWPSGADSIYNVDSVVAVADGFIISSGGNTGISTGKYTITKVSRSGQVDPTFGTAGKIIINQQNAAGRNSILKTWADGSFAVLVSHTSDGVGFSTSIRRFNANGTADSTFGENGILTSMISPWDPGISKHFEIRPDGKIVTFGNAFLGGDDPQFIVEQYLADGKVDTGFGGGIGRTVLPEVGVNQLPSAMLIDSAGRTVLVGKTWQAKQPETVLYRLDPTGKLDPAFGTGGVKSLSLSSYDENLIQIAQTKSGDLLLAGHRVTSKIVEPVFVKLAEHTPPWHNGNRRMDVSGDTLVTALDALLVINYLNAKRGLNLPNVRPAGANFVDVNGDSLCSPLDALLIINDLNSGGQAEGEGSDLPQAEGEGQVWMTDFYFDQYDFDAQSLMKKRR